MHSKIKQGFPVLFLLVFFLAVHPITAQHFLEKQIFKADSLYKSEAYFDAVTEYKRLLFFDSLKSYEFKASLNIGLCYKAGGKWENAIIYFSRAAAAAPSDSDKFNTGIMIVRSNILRRTIPRALELLERMEKQDITEGQKGEINYWKGWAYMFGDRFKEAAASFANAPGGEELKKLCDMAESEKYSVTFAKVISYILPGAGEFYTGNFLSGVLSLAWNAFFGYLTVNSFIENRIFDGIAIGGLLFLRFYRGNIQNAGNSAIEKNLEITNKTLLFIQNNYKGIKP